MYDTRELQDDEVYYCKSCHSLMVMIDDTLANESWDGSYCGKCHSADIGICTVSEWLLEEERRKKQREKIEWSK